jgi:6-phosphofructokinase 1
MGRKAGHLALGIGKAAGATITLIGEEFDPPIRLKEIVDTLTASIIKRLAEGRRDGVAVIAEGVALDISPDDLADLKDVERDEHGHVRLAEVNLGDMLKAKVSERLRALGIKTTISEKNIGYELRCADPIPFDMEYTRDLGYCAAKYLLAGGNAAMISMQGGHYPIPFSEMIDGQTDRTKVRMVDITSTRYPSPGATVRSGATTSSIRRVALLARTANLSEQEFRAQFQCLVSHEPPPLAVDEHERLAASKG